LEERFEGAVTPTREAGTGAEVHGERRGDPEPRSAGDPVTGVVDVQRDAVEAQPAQRYPAEVDGGGGGVRAS